MGKSSSRPGNYFTAAARQAALEARAARRTKPDRFGLLEVFVVKADDRTFTWEIRRFGGLLLQREAECFTSQALARADGQLALAVLCADPDLPTFARQRRLGDQAE